MQMRGRTLLTFLVVLFSCSLATAENWTVIPHQGQEIDQQIISIDKDSISTNAGVTQAWFLFSFSTPINKRYSEKHLVLFKCSQKRMLRQMIRYEDVAADGKVVDSFVLQLDPHEIALYGTGNAMFEAACTTKAKLSATPATRPASR
jgi:hypothetical protein